MNGTVRKPGKPKGSPKSGGGSRAGKPNKTTALAREAIAQFVDGNSHRLQGWLDEVAKDPKHGPKAAIDAFMGLLEYHVPKLARTEINATMDVRNVRDLTLDELKTIAAGRS